MKPILQLKNTQTLAMTPQLQQAIRLLQLSSIDLQQEIQNAVENNPMLEAADEEDINQKENFSGDSNDEKISQESLHENDNLDLNASFNSSSEKSEINDDWQDDNSDLSQEDVRWNETYTNHPHSNVSQNMDYDDRSFFENRSSNNETLSEHLKWQLNLCRLSDKDRLIGITIIDALNPNGMLETTCEDLLESFDSELEIDIDEIEAVRHRIQQFDPLGVASLNLTDCLMVQLAQLDKNTPWREEAAHVIDKYLNLLAVRDYSQLTRKIKLKENQLKEVIDLIEGLNPRPGDAYQQNTADYIIPDVYVKKISGKWTAKLNNEIEKKIPKINDQYASLINRSDTSEQNTFLREYHQEAKWFIKSIHSRNETLLKVAEKIIAYQNDFFEHGEEAMKPLVLHDIAKDVGMHESTISRVTNQKFMHTPLGIFELKYFFSSHVSTNEGGECSSIAIRARIKKMISNEDGRKPLSDNKIALILNNEKGIKVARRTVAKYRESMMIPPSNERKKLSLK